MKTKHLLKTVFSLVLITSTYVFSHAQETIIQKSELPKNSQEFINKHFSDKTISYIKKDKEIFSTDYEVKFTDLSEVEFDGNGNWKEVKGKHQPIPTGFIPDKVKSYVQTRFPENFITKAEKDPLKLEVKISNGLELTFNNSGQIVEIDD